MSAPDSLHTVWQALKQHQTEIQSLSAYFAQDEQRFQRFSIEQEGILIDYSKNHIENKTIDLLLQLAEQAQLRDWIERMLRGDKINFTEKRAVLHTALRNRSTQPIYVDGQNIMPDINLVLLQMAEFVQRVRSGQWTGFSGQPITDIVNIGIGGSDLGPRMVCTALEPYHKPGLDVHFVSNIDGADITSVLDQLNPETTLFIIASKTFTTKETMTNAHTARRWFLQKTGVQEDQIQHHFVAVSTHAEAVKSFGIHPNNMFIFWDWVGGRYSLWSAIGLPIAIMIGMDGFYQLLEGAYAMDQHFAQADFGQNMPVILGLLGIWYRNFFGASNHAILPYDHRLRLLPAYLQQADMESNGKRVTRSGQIVDWLTGPIVWGQPGTNGQHAFFQLMHQGTELVPADFILAIKPHHDLEHQHRILAANCFAQTQALMQGKGEAEVRRELEQQGLKEEDIQALLPHKLFPGNKPSTTILLPELSPYYLGSLIALYEHKIFVESIIWQINAFDQWGVELGKQLAGFLEQALQQPETCQAYDSSTNGLINYFKQS